MIPCSGTPLDPELVPSKTGNKQALCMEQYYRIFTTYRYPGEPKDFQKVDDGRRSRETETIIVMNDGHVSEISIHLHHERNGSGHHTLVF